MLKSISKKAQDLVPGKRKGERENEEGAGRHPEFPATISGYQLYNTGPAAPAPVPGPRSDSLQQSLSKVEAVAGRLGNIVVNSAASGLGWAIGGRVANGLFR